MSGHFETRCRKCNRVLAQCRCMSSHKDVRLVDERECGWCERERRGLEKELSPLAPLPAAKPNDSWWAD